MDELMSLYDMINSIYYELFQLELYNKFGCEEYDSLSVFLMEKLDYEKELGSNLFMNDKELYYKIKDKRIYRMNGNEIRLSSFAHECGLYEDDISNNQKAEQRIFRVCSDSICLLYLSFLQEEIDNDTDYRENLLNFKYLGSFVNHRLEKILLENEFYVNRENDIYLDCMLDMIKVDSSCCKDSIKRKTYAGILISEIEKLMSVNDDDHNNVDGMAISINSQCMIKACLTIMDKDDYNSLSGLINRRVKLLTAINNHKSLKIFSSLFNNWEENKKKVRRISFRPRG